MVNEKQHLEAKLQAVSADAAKEKDDLIAQLKTAVFEKEAVEHQLASQSGDKDEVGELTFFSFIYLLITTIRRHE